MCFEKLDIFFNVNVFFSSRLLLCLFSDDYDFGDDEVVEKKNGQETAENENAIVQEVANRAGASESEGSGTVNECLVNNGGCEHNCNIRQNEVIGAQSVECSCNEGYALDIDNKHCESK